MLVVGGLGLWWYLRDDAPPEVSLEAAIESARGDPTTASTGTAASATTAAGQVAVATTDAARPVDIAGAWAVDTSVGTFSFEDATGSFVGFRVQEELSSIGSTTAVGRTPEVSGTIVIDGTTLTEASVEADLTAMTTNESRRDGRVQDALETDQFPTATFALTEPVALGAHAADGAPIAVTAVGDLTIHGVTAPVQIPLEAQLVGDTVVVVGSLDIAFADYGVTPPTAPVVLSVDDNGVVELQLLLTRA